MTWTGLLYVLTILFLGAGLAALALLVAAGAVGLALAFQRRLVVAERTLAEQRLALEGLGRKEQYVIDFLRNRADILGRLADTLQGLSDDLARFRGLHYVNDGVAQRITGKVRSLAETCASGYYLLDPAQMEALDGLCGRLMPLSGQLTLLCRMHARGRAFPPDIRRELAEEVDHAATRAAQAHAALCAQRQSILARLGE